MDTYITLNELKKNLRIELENTDDDDELMECIYASEIAVSNYLNGGLSGETIEVIVSGETILTIPKDIKRACLLLAHHLFLNPSPVSFGKGYELPYSFEFLLNNYRNYTIK